MIACALDAGCEPTALLMERRQIESAELLARCGDAPVYTADREVLAKLTGLGPSTLNLVINMALLVLGFLFLGRGFAFKTVYVSLLSSIGLSVMEKIWLEEGPAFYDDDTVTDQPVLELIFAIFLPGAASAVLFNMGASSGGTDIVAMIIKKYRSLEIGVSLFVVDCLIAVSAFFVFDAQTGLFSLCGLLAKSLVIDGVIESINACKYFNIVCIKRAQHFNIQNI